MRKELERLFRDTILAPLAFAIVLGWALFVLAVSIAGFVTPGLLLSLIVLALVLGVARVVRRRSGAPGQAPRLEGFAGLRRDPSKAVQSND